MAESKPKRDPKYRRQKNKRGDLAFVELDGVRHYLGPYDSNKSREEYHRLLAEWRAGGVNRGISRQGGITITEVIAAYWKHAQAYYRKPDGMQTVEVGNVRQALRPLRQLLGITRAAEFGPLRLKAVRQAMIEAGHSRGYINDNIGRIKRMFKWAAENEVIEPSVFHGLHAVTGLRKGRSEARETEPVKPVPETHVDAVQPFVSRQVWAIVELQRVTGMRPGEVVSMRGCDLDMTGKLWTYTPERHKTEHHGHDRTIYLGPIAQRIVEPFLRTDLTAHLFSPADAEAERNGQRRSDRRSPMTPSQAARKPTRNPARPPQDRYTRDSYRRTIARACKRAGVPHWHPHQLRHNAATRLRKEYGLEAARVVLGHHSPAITELYAEIDRAKAADIMLKIG